MGLTPERLAFERACEAADEALAGATEEETVSFLARLLALLTIENAKEIAR